MSAVLDQKSREDIDKTRPPLESGRSSFLAPIALTLATFLPGNTQAPPRSEPEPGNASGSSHLVNGDSGLVRDPRNLIEAEISPNLELASFPSDIELRNETSPKEGSLREPLLTETPDQKGVQEHHGTTDRVPFGKGWFGDSLAFGVAVAIDAMALMYTRSRRLLLGDTERREEESLRKKIGFLHVVAPMAPFALGYLASDALISTGSVLGTAAVTALYTAAGAVMYAFANNVLKEEAGLEHNGEKKSLVSVVEGAVEKFGNWMIDKMPGPTWAMAMGVTVDAVISGLKFVQSSGWSHSEVALSCVIAGGVVYGLISVAQKTGAAQIQRLISRENFQPEKHCDHVSSLLSRATAAGFFAFRYFAWTGILSAGLTATGATVNEWGLRAAALGLAIGHGWKVVSKVWPKLKQAKIDDARQFLGLDEVAKLESA